MKISKAQFKGLIKHIEIELDVPDLLKHNTSRKHQYVMARGFIMMLLRYEFAMTYDEIGKLFNKNATSVMYIFQVMQHEVAHNQTARNIYTKITDKLNGN